MPEIKVSVWETFFEADDSFVDNFTWKIYDTNQHNKCVDADYKESMNNTPEGKAVDKMAVKSIHIKGKNLNVYAY